MDACCFELGWQAALRAGDLTTHRLHAGSAVRRNTRCGRCCDSKNSDRDQRRFYIQAPHPIKQALKHAGPRPQRPTPRPLRQARSAGCPGRRSICQYCSVWLQVPCESPPSRARLASHGCREDRGFVQLAAKPAADRSRIISEMPSYEDSSQPFDSTAY
jgi:hypothetical protein